MQTCYKMVDKNPTLTIGYVSCPHPPFVINEEGSYGIAHPMPADAFPNWAAHWQADPLWRRLPPLNRDDLPLLFAITELRAWMTALEHYLHKARDLPPVLDAQHSRFEQDQENFVR